MVKVSLASLLLHTSLGENTNYPSRTPSFFTSSVSDDDEGPIAFKLKSRVYVPFGKGEGYGFGMGAAEQAMYDYVEKYAYTVSEQGYVNVIDYGRAHEPVVIPEFAIDFDGFKLTDIEICDAQGLLIIGYGAKDLVSNGGVRVYSAVSRKNPSKPVLLHDIEVGPLPDMVKPNHECTMVAVANEGEGSYDQGYLVDPPGSVSIISGIVEGNPSVRNFEFDFGTDDELIAQGIHLPLPLKALEYWDLHSDIADELDFTAARAAYTPATNLEPEYLGWSGDGKKVYVNLEENSALVTVDVQTGKTRIDSLGLKDWSADGPTNGLDMVKDEQCIQAHYPGYKTLRHADTLTVVNVDGQDYILLANEGDDKEYGEFAEKMKMKDLIEDGVVKMRGATATDEVLANHAVHTSAGIDSKHRVTVGSAGVDYSDPQAPVIKAIVGFGGRSISVYKPTESGLELVWDSQSQIEKEQCRHFPWAHNSCQDEEYSRVNGAFYNSSDADVRKTLEEMNDPEVDGCVDGGDGKPGACPMGQTIDERSPKDGAAPETVVAGVACGRLMAVTATEKQSTVFVYDMSSIKRPQLKFVDHLTPASETKNPSVAYAARELGDIDPELMVFLEAEHSPSGRAGVLFGGAWSGTMSMWEFVCDDDDVVV